MTARPSTSVPVERLEAVLDQLDRLTAAHRLDAGLLGARLGKIEHITDRDSQVAHESSEESFRFAAGLLRGAMGLPTTRGAGS